ncbi:MAG: hypothetical protein A2Y33_14010 [Spirochaetes bacterium GWF1_51_8]|nr:MAG: hypothetical protein A2Y33_14010 [Spirochaetes bacterium GWF1_51_8]
MRRFSILLIILFAGFPGIVSPMATIFRAEMGKTELLLEFDPYYMPLGWIIPLSGDSVPVLELAHESHVYGYLLSTLFSFQTLVLEASAYPLPLLGAGIRAWMPEFYQSCTVFPGFNLVESLTTSYFQEPYAISLFLGQVVNFTTPKQIDIEIRNNVIITNLYGGNAYSGFLISYGSHHIKKNLLIPDDWLEIELKLKGGRINADTDMSWNYKLGARVHFHPEIDSYFYFWIKRDHLDKKLNEFSFIYNCFLEGYIWFSADDWNFLKAMVMYGKNFPVADGKLVLGIGIGVIWNITPMYQGSLVDTEWTEFQLLVVPVIRF